VVDPGASFDGALGEPTAPGEAGPVFAVGLPVPTPGTSAPPHAIVSVLPITNATVPHRELILFIAQAPCVPSTRSVAAFSNGRATRVLAHFLGVRARPGGGATRASHRPALGSATRASRMLSSMFREKRA
jgi:hypothetical protein